MTKVIDDILESVKIFKQEFTLASPSDGNVYSPFFPKKTHLYHSESTRRHSGSSSKSSKSSTSSTSKSSESSKSSKSKSSKSSTSSSSSEKAGDVCNKPKHQNNVLHSKYINIPLPWGDMPNFDMNTAEHNSCLADM
eukprot:CAMPEP_0113864752 /NCGR_PEP_ID=MMETSP0372-20130328/17557_1 /TAXON_ID=340204 /ORGANISM="Lankesteria abbotti" /LENGTH=136 /DNA_ID=CAMNT_0000848081 /DNA_START=338 /DNA_END=748 /DNA_ORIENTATION=- /assembly_acc=CAM_ASM_000359